MLIESPHRPYIYQSVRLSVCPSVYLSVFSTDYCEIYVPRISNNLVLSTVFTRT